MAIDYAKLSAVAIRLIGDNGRGITLRRRPLPVPDAGIPWEPSAPASATGADMVAAIGVQASLSQAQRALSVVEASDTRWLIAAYGAPDDLGVEWEILDDSAVYSIVALERIKPGSTAIYFDAVGRV